MKITKITDIVVKENRQRTEFPPEKMQELRDSIEFVEGQMSKQLLHPVVLRSEGNSLVLVAGERRLRVLQEIFELGGSFLCNGILFEAARGEIPYTDVGDLSELEYEELELDENLKRLDLTWQEHAAAVERLHNLRVRQKPKVVELSSESDPQDPELNKPVIVGTLHTVADTAKELHGRSDGAYLDTTRKEIIVAKHLDNPLIAKAKSADEAFKILKKEEQRARHAALADTVGATFSVDKHQLILGDCLDWMRLCAMGPSSEHFDVICTDPPYGMGADNFGDGGGKMSGISHAYDDSFEGWLALMKEWVPLSFKIAKAQAHAYVFCDIDNFHLLRDMMREAGWYVFRTPFTVHKLNSGRVPLPDRGPRRVTEWILYAIKGDKPVTHIYPDLIACQGDPATFHGAQKPVSLYQALLQRSVKPGDRVFDGFAGTGPIFEAAHTYKCTAVGVEMEKAAYGLCLKRLESIRAQESGDLLGDL